MLSEIPNLRKKQKLRKYKTTKQGNTRNTRSTSKQKQEREAKTDKITDDRGEDEGPQTHKGEKTSERQVELLSNQKC